MSDELIRDVRRYFDGYPLIDALIATYEEQRRLLESSEAALQEAQRALFRWLPNRIGSEYDNLIAADAMALMGLESTEGLREIGGEILIELMEKRRLLDDARAQVPIVQCYSTTHGAWLDCTKTDCTNVKRTVYLSAPVPAQPAAESTCAWSENDDGFYETECGNSFQFIDGGAADNNATFCQYCGKKIDEHWFDDMPADVEALLVAIDALDLAGDGATADWPEAKRVGEQVRAMLTEGRKS